MTTEQLYQIYLKHPNVETDSRKINKECLFFALKGDSFNGNKFAAEALYKGAAYAVIDEEEFAIPGKTILVKDVLDSLQKLANYHRRQLKIPVIGITGSNGKTTTKELIAAVLSVKYRIVNTQGNLNNHIGVPLTLLRMDDSTQIGIIEMGANHAGEIAELCTIADPDFGIITNIGIAHLEGFGSFEVIKKTKAGLYDHVKGKNGLIFYNSDNPVLSELTEKVGRKISFGSGDADFTGELTSATPFLNVMVNLPGEAIEIKTQLVGSYNFENIMAAACIGNHFKVEPRRITDALSGYRPQNNRSQMIEKNSLKIVMDAYNANPSSMKASIESFVAVFNSSRSIILGDMLELGANAIEEHVAVLDKISKYPFEQVLLVGPLFSAATKNYPFKAFFNTQELTDYLKSNPITNGAVLIKGSRGIQLEKVLEFL